MRAGLLLALLLAGCGDFVPVVQADRDSPKFLSDLSACQTEGADAADRRVKARGPLFLTYPVSFPLTEREEITACMQKRGYAAAD